MRELRDQYLVACAALPTVAVCVAHDGELDDAEVARVGVAASPAVLVTCLGVEETVSELAPGAGRCRWVAVVLARPPDAVRCEYASAGDLAAVIALRIVRLLETGVFGASLERATNVRAANLVGTTAARRGYALWAVTWTAPTVLEHEGPELHPLRLIHTDVAQAGTVVMTARAEVGAGAAPAASLELVTAPALSVDGEPVVGAALQLTAAVWSGARQVQYALLRSGALVAVAGSQPPAYVIAEADRGHTLMLRSVAVGDDGDGGVADSDPLHVPEEDP